jgi:imidazoleglycerol-phosphate dehydratase
MAEHFWQSFATAAAITLHVRMRSGRNTHHVLEATFKGVARALRDAVRVEGAAIPSTKGQL